MERTRTSEQTHQNKEAQALREKADRFLRSQGYGKKGQKLKGAKI